MSDENRMVVESVNVSDIVHNKYQPRGKIDEEQLTDLEKSINGKHGRGIIDPIILRALPNSNKKEIIKGHKRFEIEKKKGKKIIKAVVKYGMDDKTSALEALLSNEHFEFMNPFDRAAAFRNIQKLYGLKSDKELSDFLGMTAHNKEGKPNYSKINNALAYEKIVPEVREKSAAADLTTRDISRLARLEPKEQIKAAEIIEKQDLKWNDVDKLVPILKDKKTPEPIKEAILEQKVDAKEAMDMIDIGISDEMVQPVVEELTQRKTGRELDAEVKKKRDKAILKGELKPTTYAKEFSQDDANLEYVRLLKDKIYVKSNSIIADIKDPGKKKEAKEKVEWVIQKLRMWLEFDQTVSGVVIESADIDINAED